MANGISVKLPLVVSQTDGAYALVKDYLEMIKQNLKMNLLTCPGERIMDINYGVGLRNYLFLENSPMVINNLSAKIYEQVASYFPFIEIEELNIHTDESENMLFVRMSYNIIPLGEQDLLKIDKKIE